MDIRIAKRAMRVQVKKRRDQAAQDLGDDGTRSFFEHLIKTWNVVSETYGGHECILAAYWPMGGEMDVRPALVALDRIGVTLCLPEVVAPERPLRFRAWTPNEPLIEGPHKTFQPLNHEPLMRPDVVLVPLLAFDRAGYRLGWGGGYYDRTLELLRKVGPITAVGVAYSTQEVDQVPRDDYDQPLDWVLTETEAIKIT